MISSLLCFPVVVKVGQEYNNFRYGHIAQPGEHLGHNQKVVGSSPAVPMKTGHLNGNCSDVFLFSTEKSG